MKAGKLSRFTLLLFLSIAPVWLTIWSSTSLSIQAQPLEGLDAAVVNAQSRAPAGRQEVREDDLLDQVLAAGTLVVATDLNYPPFSFLNLEGEMDGFDVDVAKDVANRLGVDLAFQTPEWSAVVAGDWGALWDVSIGSMTPTDDRALVLWFTYPYYYNPAVFAVHRDNTIYIEPADLWDRKVGVGTRTPYEEYLEGALDVLELAKYGGVISYPPPTVGEIVAYSTDYEALQDLALGDGTRLDAILSSQLLIQAAIDQGVPVKYLGTPAFSEPVVFALDQARGPSDLMIAELNSIIADMRGDGTLASISIEWLGIDITSPGPSLLQPRAFLPVVIR